MFSLDNLKLSAFKSNTLIIGLRKSGTFVYGSQKIYKLLLRLTLMQFTSTSKEKGALVKCLVTLSLFAKDCWFESSSASQRLEISVKTVVKR